MGDGGRGATKGANGAFERMLMYICMHECVLCWYYEHQGGEVCVCVRLREVRAIFGLQSSLVVVHEAKHQVILNCGKKGRREEGKKKETQ